MRRGTLIRRISHDRKAAQLLGHVSRKRLPLQWSSQGTDQTFAACKMGSNATKFHLGPFEEVLTLFFVHLPNDLPNSSLESLCVEIKPAHSAPFLVLAWYRPPGASGEICDQLEKTLEFLDKEGKEIILLGDTNCDILSNYPTVLSERSPN